MTVQESLITWLKTFKLNSKGMTSIDTDVMRGSASYMVVREPTRTEKSDILGNVTRTERYTLHARLSSQTDKNCKDNSTWGFALEEWIETNAKNRNYPTLKDGNVTDLKIISNFVIGVTETNNSVYQLTVAITYKK